MILEAPSLQIVRLLRLYHQIVSSFILGAVEPWLSYQRERFATQHSLGVETHSPCTRASIHNAEIFNEYESLKIHKLVHDASSPPSGVRPMHPSLQIQEEEEKAVRSGASSETLHGDLLSLAASPQNTNASPQENTELLTPPGPFPNTLPATLMPDTGTYDDEDEFKPVSLLECRDAVDGGRRLAYCRRRR